MLSDLFSVIYRDLLLYCRQSSDWSLPVIFFTFIVSVFPMSLSLQPTQLIDFGPAIIWVAVVLALLISLEALFRIDYAEGLVNQYLLGELPVSIILLGKSIAHWIAVGLPLWAAALIFGVLFDLPSNVVEVLMVSLSFGIPIISLIGCLGAVLTIGLYRGGVLLSVILLPLLIPILLLGIGSVFQVAQGLNPNPQILVLTALWVLCVAFGPWVSAWILRMSIE